MYDLMIIGGGPAAVSAACYAREKRINFVMLFDQIGGQVGWAQSVWGPLPSHQLPSNELMHLLTTRITHTPEHLIRDRAVKVLKRDRSFAVETQTQRTLEATVLLIATGATPCSLPLPNADRLLDPRLHSSITTYAHLVAGQRVAVIGTTQRALHGVAELVRTAEQIYLIDLGLGNLATPFGQTLRRQPNVELLEGYEVREILGQDTARELVVARDGTIRHLTVDHAFVSLGLRPNCAFIQSLVDTDPSGSILVNEHHETTMAGIFAAGDVTTMRSEQVTVSIGDGARAAARAFDYLLAQWLVFGAPAPIADEVVRQPVEAS